MWFISKPLVINRYCMIGVFFSDRSAGQGGKEYYTLESLLFLLKNVSLSHPMYVQRAGVSRTSTHTQFVLWDGKGVVHVIKAWQ